MAIKGVAVELGKKHSIRQKFKVSLRLDRTRKRHALPKRNSSATIQLNIDYRNIDCIALNQVLYFFLRINSCLQMPNCPHTQDMSVHCFFNYGHVLCRKCPRVPTGVKQLSGAAGTDQQANSEEGGFQTSLVPGTFTVPFDEYFLS